MKLATLKDGRLVAVSDNQFVALEKVGFEGTLLDLIRAGNGKLKSMADFLGSVTEKEFLDIENLEAPLENPSKIVAIGLNYVDHASESKMELPKSPLVFTKFPSSITSPFGPILIPMNLTNEVDYEAELGVVVGKRAKNVSLKDALSYVFGYTVLNDVSARDLQFGDQQWVRGKSLDTFCPMGPYVVTADEIPDPQNLEIGCSVNGETLQDANTRDMIFKVADLISQLSHSFTLEPGDVIATGTPSGVGFSRKPPVLLKPGDIVKTWVKGIGELVNPVKKA